METSWSLRPGTPWFFFAAKTLNRPSSPKPVSMASNHAVEIIARRLSIRPEEAAQALGKLSAQLLHQVRRHRRVHVSGLGTFKLDGDIIEFEPSKDLDALVNADFADLEPVRIKAPQPIARLRADRQRARQRRRPRAMWAVAGCAVLVAGAFLLTREQLPLVNLLSRVNAPAQPMALEEESPPEVVFGNAVSDGVTSDVREDTTAASGSPSAEDAPPASVQSAESPEPATIDEAQGGYTVVIASFRELVVAQSEASRYRALVQDPDVPVDVLRAAVDGTEQFRVAVGQVPTASEALALRSRLSALPESAWVRRIGIDG